MVNRSAIRIQGTICSSLIVVYWSYGTVIPWTTILMPSYESGMLSVGTLGLFCFFSLMTILSFLRAVFHNPGFVFLHSKQTAYDPTLPYCVICQSPKPPRAHHCSTCNACILKMDHHCPWVNNCIGQGNQWAFIQLLFYTCGLSLFTLIQIVRKMYYLPPCAPAICPHVGFLYENKDVFDAVTLAMAASMAFSSFLLLCSQHTSIFLVNLLSVNAILGYCFTIISQKELAPLNHETAAPIGQFENPTNRSGCFIF